MSLRDDEVLAVEGAGGRAGRNTRLVVTTTGG
jgi:hypothetical protein